MNAALVHRGPDAGGAWQDAEKAIYLGHRRLSIIDLAGGAQPMWTSDGDIGIIFNGEIYNHRELRSQLELEGVRFQTDHSDTEVLLHGYRLWGDGFVRHLNGMWAFVIYDKSRQRLFGSRDRFGKKPLYYLLKPDLLVFASELNSLTAHRRVSPSLSPLALKKYFAYGYIPAPHSIYQGIQKLPGGWNFEFDLIQRHLKTWQYWDFVIEPTDRIPVKPEEEWAETLRALIERAVARRLISDVPIGAFLSGGIDSTAIAGFASRLLGPNRLNTYSIGFEERSYDESDHARKAADYVRSRHHCRLLPMETARRIIPEVLSRLDEPMGDPSLLPTYLLCGFAREDVTVALGGDGADELFAGYDPFRALEWARLYERLVPNKVHRAIALIAARMPVSHRNMSLDFRIKRTLRGLSYPQELWCPVWMAPLGPEDWEACFNEPWNPEEIYAEAIQLWDDCQQSDLVDKTLQFYTKLYLQNAILVKVDRASMMHSLEVRSPFLDIELVDFVRTIPWAYKLRYGQTKFLLKKALEPILPTEVIYRKKKGFGVPTGKWFQAALGDSLAMTQLPALCPGFLKAKLTEHKNRMGNHREVLWNSLVYSRSPVLEQASGHDRGGV